MLEQSRLAAQRLVSTQSSDEALVRQAYREILARSPGPRELRLALDFVTVSASEQDAEARRLDNWSLLIQTLFASVDFRYLN